MQLPEAQELIKRFEYLKGRRNNFEKAWQDITDLMMPYRGDITTKRSQGQRRVKGVFDTTAMNAADSFVNFIKGAIIPSGNDWVRLRAKAPFSDILAVRQVLDVVGERILAALADSNFYKESATFLRDFAVLGNGTLHVREDIPRLGKKNRGTFGGLVFEAVPIGHVWFQVGHRGRPNYIVRQVVMTALDAFRFFEGAAGPDVEYKLNAGDPMGEVSFLHFVFENEDFIPGGVISPEDREYVGVYVAGAGDASLGKGGIGGPTVIRKAGYDTCPYIVARWMVVDGEEYGRGRGHLARADAMGINELRRQILIAAGKDLNPPLMVEHDTVVELDITPNGLMVTRPAVKMGPQYLKSDTNYAIADAIARQDRDQIQKAFLGDILEEPDTQPRSAEESRQRQNRALSRLSASADTVNYEFLDPLIQSVIDIMHRAGSLPELDYLQEMAPDADFEIVYQSPFFTAQRQSGVTRVQAFMERRLALFQVTQDPIWLDDLNSSEATNYDARVSDVPAQILRSPEEVSAIRQARAEQKQVEQRMAQMQQVAAMQQGGPQQGPPQQGPPKQRAPQQGKSVDAQ
jgi:hypothetical protein